MGSTDPFPFRNCAFCCVADYRALKDALPAILDQLPGLGIHLDRSQFFLKWDIYCDPERCYLFDDEGTMHTFVTLPHEGIAPETAHDAL